MFQLCLKLATRVPINNMYEYAKERERERESTPNGGRTPGTGKRTHREMFAAMCKRISGPLKRHAA